MRQGANESLQSCVRRFVHVKCQAVSLSEDSIIDMAKKGLLHGPLWRKQTPSYPGSIFELLRKLEQYARVDDDKLHGARDKEQ